MSRIGNKPIPVPKGITVEIQGSHIKVTGAKGTLERELRPEIEVIENDGIVQVKPRDDSRRTVAFSGLSRSLLNNMVQGVHEGFQRKLVIEGVGYRAEVGGSALTLNIGYSNPVKFELPEGVKGSVEKMVITLESIDKELLGLTAARIRSIRPPEPYKGKGIRYQDEHVVRKAGKAAGKK